MNRYTAIKKYCAKTTLTHVPLLHETLSLFSSNILENILLLARQHLLTDTYFLLLALEQLGLKREHIAIMGKCYSTNAEVVQRMREHNFEVFVPEIEFDSHRSFDEQHLNDVKTFVTAQLKKHDVAAFNRVIVLDDGGDLIIEVQNQLKKTNNVIGVEQTTNGYNKLKTSDMWFPVINVARCKSKLVVEYKFVVEAILTVIERYISTKKIVVENILVIGNGAIGSAICQQLANKFKKVYCYDLISAQNNMTIKDYLPLVDLIIGCTGCTSVPKQYHAYLKKQVILASASSSDREFDAVYLRRAVERTHHPHTNIVVDSIYLLNNGFPVNFHGGQYSMPLSASQLTISLLLAGVCQASKVCDNKAGFTSLSAEEENFILNRFEGKYISGDTYNVDRKNEQSYAKI